MVVHIASPQHYPTHPRRSTVQWTSEINRMAAEASKSAAEDEAQKCIETLTSLSFYVNGLKFQLGNSKGLGGKVDCDDKKMLLDAITSVLPAGFCMTTSRGMTLVTIAIFIDDKFIVRRIAIYSASSLAIFFSLKVGYQRE